MSECVWVGVYVCVCVYIYTHIANISTREIEREKVLFVCVCLYVHVYDNVFPPVCTCVDREEQTGRQAEGRTLTQINQSTRKEGEWRKKKERKKQYERKEDTIMKKKQQSNDDKRDYLRWGKRKLLVSFYSF